MVTARNAMRNLMPTLRKGRLYGKRIYPVDTLFWPFHNSPYEILKKMEILKK